jgi:2-isopropylmalate synthase
VAYIMKAEHGLDLPRRLQVEFSKTIQHITEDTGTEISPAALWHQFEDTYLPEDSPIQLLSHETTTGDKTSRVTAQMLIDGAHATVNGEGNGPIAAFVHGLSRELGLAFDVVDYSEHAVSAGTDATAVAYVEVKGGNGEIRWGVGRDESILTASLKGVVSAVNRLR